MTESFSKVIAMIIAVVLLYIFPIENMLIRQDDTARIVVFNETAKFVDSVRNLGYITPLMYLQFMNVLSATGNHYEIYMEHRHGSIDPVYIDPDDTTSFQRTYNVNAEAVYSEDIFNKLFPDPSTPSDDTKYYFTKGDYFSVSVVNKNKTAASKVQEMLYMSEMPVKRIIVNYGGMIRDEAD